MKYETKLLELTKNDDRILVMTAENRAPMRGIIGELGERFIDTGITEQTLVGSAAGLALRGRVPVAHALATFLTMRAFEFIRTDVALANLPVKLVGFVPGFLSDGNGPTHQAIEDVALMRCLPNMEIFCPGDEAELVAGLKSAVESPRPVYIRYNTRPAIAEHKEFKWGEAESFGPTHADVTLLTYGTLFSESFQARQLLEASGISCRLLNLRTIRPLDEKAVIEAAKQSSLLVTVEDHFIQGGLFTVLSEVLVRNRLQAHVLPLGMDGVWYRPARFQEVLDFEGFTGPKIAERVGRHWSETGSDRE